MDANAVRRLFLWVLDQKGLTPEEAEKPTGLSRQTIRNHMKDDPPKLVGKTLRQMRAYIAEQGVPATQLSEAEEKLIAARWMAVLSEQLRSEATSSPGDERAAKKGGAGRAALRRTRRKPPGEGPTEKTGSD